MSRSVFLFLALSLLDPFAFAAEPPPNTLTSEEKSAGWLLLFNGTTTEGWRGYNMDKMPPGWQVVNGALVRASGGKGGKGAGGGDDIITVDQFDDFELKLEWKVVSGGNSGILYRVVEGAATAWHVAPEMQVLDNTPHTSRKKSQLAGALYDLYEPAQDATRPVGEWNEARVVAKGNHVEHWLNGVKLLEYEVGSEDWNQRLENSKFKTLPKFAKARKGHICLQDHTLRMEYRNLMIRKLK